MENQNSNSTYNRKFENTIEMMFKTLTSKIDKMSAILTETQISLATYKEQIISLQTKHKEIDKNRRSIEDIKLSLSPILDEIQKRPDCMVRFANIEADLNEQKKKKHQKITKWGVILASIFSLAGLLLGIYELIHH